MPKNFFALLVGAIVATAPPEFGSAAVLNPIATSGQDQDIIFEAGLTAGQTGASGELGSRQFFEAGVFADGIPRMVSNFTNSLTGNIINFAFQPFEQNNILKFDTAATPKTLTLPAPGRYSQLAIVQGGGSLALPAEIALLTYTINYAGGQTQTGIVNVIDWGAATTLPSGTERFLIADRTTADARTWPVSSDNNTTANRWAIYLSEITPTRSDLNIESITFGPISLSNTTTMAVGPLNSGDDVVVFGLAGAGDVVVVAPAITNQPQSLTVEQGRPAALSVGVSGSPLSFQWRKDGSPIAGANSSTYRITSATLTDSGIYSVAITNSLGSVTSSNATLTVIPDTNGPVLLRAIGNAAGDIVTLTFSEALDASGGEAFNYGMFAAGSGEELLISFATLTNGTNVILVNDPSTPRVQGQNYTVRVADVRDVFGNTVRPNPTTFPIRPDAILIGFDTDNVWRYDINNGDRTGTGWETVGFNDSSWPSGAAPLGRDVTAGTVQLPIRTELPYMTNGVVVYFRKHFTLPSTNGVTLALRDVVEDGAVYYLNGKEVFRNRMPTGVVTNATLATGAPDPTPISGPFQLSITNLVPGDNVLAVEVHQSSTNSTDIEFAAELVANIAGFGPSAPRINFTQNANNTITLTWNAPGFCLQQANALGGSNVVWTTSTVMNGVPFNPTNAARFYRLSNSCN